MRLKLYRAASIPAAIAQVRAELGAEALILATRRWHDGVELTAALEPPGSVTTGGQTHDDALSFHAVPSRLRGALSSDDLAASLSRIFTFGALPLGARPLLLAGPPGAGKTLTVVRLATRLAMAGQRPTVITTDDAKPGATEQLLAFTRLLDVPLHETGDALALSRMVRRDGTPVLIDTRGTDPFDPAQTNRLRALTVAAGGSIVLVLPAGLDPDEATDIAHAFAAAGAVCLVATRLDVTRRLGGILAAADAARLSLTEAGIGPGAADGLVPLTPDFLATRLLQTGPSRHAS